MKFTLALCLITGLLGTIFIGSTRRHQILPAQAQAVAPRTFYVAPNGSDTAAGSREAPFATLEHARQAVLNLKKQQGGQFQQPVTVLLRGGTYVLSAPLSFSPADSGTATCPVTYKSVDGETVVISSGQKLGPWQAEGDGLWHARVPDNLNTKDAFRQLRLGTSDAIRARTPNFDPQNPYTGGWWFTQRTPNDIAGRFGQAVGSNQKPGTQLSWTVNVPTAGNYAVWFRYAQNAPMAMEGRSTLRAGNGPRMPMMDLPNTGGGNIFQWSKSAVLPLNAGEQTVTWENVKGGGLNMDALVVTNDPNWEPANADSTATLPAAAPGTQRILIQAEAVSNVVGTADIPDVSRDRINLKSDLFARVPQNEWSGAEVNIFPDLGWINARLPVTGVDPQHSSLLVQSKADIEPNNRFYVENVRSALDSPGEWFWDKAAGEVLYQPRPNDSPNSVGVVPGLDRLIVLTGNAGANNFVENIRFEGLTFMDTKYTLGGYFTAADSAIWMQAAKQCVVANCAFEHLGGYAVRMEQRSNENSVVHCSMKGLGEGGVTLVGDTSTQAFNNVIAANDISDCGRFYAHVSGVSVSTGSGNQILNNRIQRMPRYGVMFGSTSTTSYSHNNVAAYNVILDTNLETNDTGAIATLGRDKADSGNRIEYNLIRNVVGLKVTPDGVIHTPTVSWGIYLDDLSSGTTVRGNVVDGTASGGVFIHDGRDNTIDNNVFLNGIEANVRVQGRNNEFMRNNTFTHNIVAYSNPDALIWYSDPKTWNRDMLGEVDNNVYWQFGRLELRGNRQNMTPASSLNQWRGLGLDQNSVIADPQFVDLQGGNYNLRADSPAIRLGFKPLPFEKMGPQGYNH